MEEVGFEDVSVERCVECVATFTFRLNERGKEIAEYGKNEEREGHHGEEMRRLWTFMG